MQILIRRVALYSDDVIILALLTRSKDRDTRYWVAANHSTPPESLRSLQHDKDKFSGIRRVAGETLDILIEKGLAK